MKSGSGLCLRAFWSLSLISLLLLLLLVYTLAPFVIGYNYEMPAADLQRELGESEEYWKGRMLAERAETPEALTTGYQPVISQGSTFWTYFKPTFPCPLEVERVGSEGDGGKYVCGFRQIRNLPHCIVYSFGIGDEISFERAVLKETSCIVRMFDIIDIRYNPSQLLRDFPGRVTYAQQGLGGSRYGSLKRFFKRNNDSFIDILKIDIDGDEWSGLGKVSVEFGQGLPIGQLQVEIHMKKVKRREQYVRLRNLFTVLHTAGLRPFHREENPSGPHFWEYSFLSVRYGMFKIHKNQTNSSAPANSH